MLYTCKSEGRRGEHMDALEWLQGFNLVWLCRFLPFLLSLEMVLSRETISRWMDLEMQQTYRNFDHLLSKSNSPHSLSSNWQRKLL